MIRSLPLLALFATLTPLADGGAAAPLALVRSIPLPGVRGRFDHFACDVAGQRLFVAALGNDTLEVIDVARGERAGTIDGLRMPTGVVFLSDPGRLGVANGSDGSFRTYDARTLAPMSRIEGLEDADNVRWDGASGLVYVGYGNGGLGVIDAAGRKTAGSVRLPAHPESFQIERQGTRIFANVPGAGEIVVVDREQKRVTTHWSTGGFRANFPLALDEVDHRLFVGCRRPARLLILNTGNGATVAEVEIAGDVDDVFFDRQRQRIYTSCGEGFLDTVACGSGDDYERIGHEATRNGARTCFFSPELDRLFLAVPARGNDVAEIREYRLNSQ